MPLEDALNNPSQTAAVPQADTERVARSLVGDDLVNRYGDVLGIRKPGLADAARDFALGMTHGADKVTQLKMQVRDEYDKRQLQAQRRGMAQVQIEKEKVNGFFDLVNKARSLPNKSLAQTFLKEQLPQLGYGNNAAMIKLIMDPTFFDQPTLQHLMTLSQDDPAAFSQALQEATNGDLNKAVQLGNQIKEASAKERKAGLDAIDLRLKEQKLENEKTKAAGGPMATAATRTMAEAAPKVLGFIDRIEADIPKVAKKSGPAKGRWNKYMVGELGAKDPEWSHFRTNLKLLSTLLMRMHVGARGGEGMMRHFESILGQGQQDPDNLRSSLSAIRDYANDVAGGHAAPEATALGKPKGLAKGGPVEVPPGGNEKAGTTGGGNAWFAE